MGAKVELAPSHRVRNHLGSEQSGTMTVQFDVTGQVKLVSSKQNVELLRTCAPAAMRSLVPICLSYSGFKRVSATVRTPRRKGSSGSLS